MANRKDNTPLKNKYNISMLFLLDKLGLADTHQHCLLQPEELEGSDKIPVIPSLRWLGESNDLAKMLIVLEHSVL